MNRYNLAGIYCAALLLSISCYGDTPANEGKPPSISPTDSRGDSALSQPPPDKACDLNCRLYVQDGQFTSHLFQVCIKGDVPNINEVELSFFGTHTDAKCKRNPLRMKWKSLCIARNYNWVENHDGVIVPFTGTLVLFNISSFDTHWKSMMRVWPRLTVMPSGQSIIAECDVDVANVNIGILYTVALIISVIFIFYLMAYLAGDSLIKLLCGTDGYLSLAKTQIAIWTLAVGGIVFLYGQAGLEISQVPSSVLALLGTSILTCGVAVYKSGETSKLSKSNKRGNGDGESRPKFSDLITTYDSNKRELSLAKTQMMFWTIIMIILFIGKSYLDRRIWDIPETMVVLMGFSQASYLAPKIIPPGSNTPPPDGSTQKKSSQPAKKQV